MDKIKILQNIIDQSSNIVFFGGAGVSTASGLKDFRSSNGLYQDHPEEILSHHFFINHPDKFYKFYRDNLNPLNYQPNIIHYYLKDLEKTDKLKAIITQNIDNFHTLAGSKNVIELHGNIMRNYCMKCHKFYDATYVFKSKDIPLCSCKGLIKPDVILYEEALNEENIKNAINYISNCETLIIAGTSLAVYPAASFIKFFNGKNLVVLNKQSTPIDNIATLIINDDLKEIFSKLHI